MVRYTNKGLVNHCKQALGAKTIYMWGGIYRPVSQQLSLLVDMYGTRQYPPSRIRKLKSVPNYYGIDCVGLVKSYYWSGNSGGGSGSRYYDKPGYPDVNVHDMYNAAKVKGKIDTLPEIPGIILYCKTHPHVGVYVGNGKVIESTLGSRGDGVVMTNVEDFKWEYWFRCPYIEYVDSTVTITATKTVPASEVAHWAGKASSLGFAVKTK